MPRRKRQHNELTGDDEENVYTVEQEHRAELYIADWEDDEEEPAESVQIIHEQQIALRKLMEMVRGLKSENRELSSRRGFRSAPVGRESEEDDLIDTQGRCFTVMDFAFIPSPRLLGKNPGAVTNPVDRSICLRYQEVLPPSVGERWSEERVYKLFVSGAQQSRSNLIYRVKHLKPHLVYEPEFVQKVVTQQELDKSQFREFLGFNAETSKYDLFGPYVMSSEGTCNMVKMFNVGHLPKVLKCILKGPESLEAPSGKMGRSEVNADIWDVGEVTPGAMAFAATAVRFIWSEDVEFVPKGKKTGIDYHLTFNRLKEIALRYWDFAAFQATKEMYNKFIFGVDDGKGNGTAFGEDDEEYNGVMDELEALEAERDELDADPPRDDLPPADQDEERQEQQSRRTPPPTSPSRDTASRQRPNSLLRQIFPSGSGQPPCTRETGRNTSARHSVASGSRSQTRRTR